MSSYSPKHRADSLVRLTPLRGYRPRHCSGVTATGGDCLHEHDTDRRCSCRQVILSVERAAITTTVKPVNASQRTSPIPTWHSETFCHVVSSASLGLTKAGA